MKPGQKPQLPEGHIAINAEDKPYIRELGKKLEKFFIDEAEAHGGKLEIKFILGSIDYVVVKIQDRANALLDNVKNTKLNDFMTAINTVTELGLSDKVQEPFADVEEVPPHPASVPPTNVEQIAQDGAAPANVVSPIQPSDLNQGGGQANPGSPA